MSHGSPDPYSAPSPAFDAPSPAVSINSATGRPLKGKGSRGPYKKRKKDGGQASGESPASGGRDEFPDLDGLIYGAEGSGSAGGGGGSAAGGRTAAGSRRGSVTSVDFAYPGAPASRSARGETPMERRGGSASTPAPTPGPSGPGDDDDDEDVVDDENELNRLDDGEGEGGEGEAGEVRMRIQRVKEDQILLTEHMSDAQRDRFDAWKVATLNRQAVKRHIIQTTANTITDDMAQIIGGVAKVYVGQVMSIARRVQQERGDKGKGVGVPRKRKLFMR